MAQYIYTADLHGRKGETCVSLRRGKVISMIQFMDGHKSYAFNRDLEPIA